MGKWTVSDFVTCFGDPLLPLGCLVQPQYEKKYLILLKLVTPWNTLYTWEVCPFLRRNEEEWIGGWGKRGGLGGFLENRKEGGEPVIGLRKIN